MRTPPRPPAIAPVVIVAQPVDDDHKNNLHVPDNDEKDGEPLPDQDPQYLTPEEFPDDNEQYFTPEASPVRGRAQPLCITTPDSDIKTVSPLSARIIQSSNGIVPNGYDIPPFMAFVPPHLYPVHVVIDHESGASSDSNTAYGPTDIEDNDDQDEDKYTDDEKEEVEQSDEQ